MRRGFYNPRTARKVKDGKVQKKNNHRHTVWRGFVVDRASPRQGFKHLVSKREIFDFIELIPNYRELLYGIECIILTPGSETSDGRYVRHSDTGTGTIEISAWRSDLVQEIPAWYFGVHQSIFEKIELKSEKKDDVYTCWFDEAKAKAFILTHVFVHELGHHHDRMNRKHAGSRGEGYAEDFANRLEDAVWPSYVARFGKP